MGNEVATLVDHNLLKRMEQSDGEPRFGMLETIREYGQGAGLQRDCSRAWVLFRKEGNREVLACCAIM